MDRTVDALLAAIALQQSEVTSLVKRIEAGTQAQYEDIIGRLDSLSAQVSDLRSDVADADARSRRCESAIASLVEIAQSSHVVLGEQERASAALGAGVSALSSQVSGLSEYTRRAVAGAELELVQAVRSAVETAVVPPMNAPSSSSPSVAPAVVSGGRPLAENTRLLRSLLLRPVVDEALRARVGEVGSAVAAVEAAVLEVAEQQRLLLRTCVGPAVQAPLPSLELAPTADYASVASRLEAAQRSLAALRAQQMAQAHLQPPQPLLPPHQQQQQPLSLALPPLQAGRVAPPADGGAPPSATPTRRGLALVDGGRSVSPRSSVASHSMRSPGGSLARRDPSAREELAELRHVVRQQQQRKSVQPPPPRGSGSPLPLSPRTLARSVDGGSGSGRPASAPLARPLETLSGGSRGDDYLARAQIATARAQASPRHRSGGGAGDARVTPAAADAPSSESSPSVASLAAAIETRSAAYAEALAAAGVDLLAPSPVAPAEPRTPNRLR